MIFPVSTDAVPTSSGEVVINLKVSRKVAEQFESDSISSLISCIVRELMSMIGGETYILHSN